MGECRLLLRSCVTTLGLGLTMNALPSRHYEGGRVFIPAKEDKRQKVKSF